MLELLAEYAHRNELPGPGFMPKTVRWAIVCDANGRFQEVVELGDVGQPRNRGQAFPRCPDLSEAEIKSGGVVRSHFLVDAAQVVALYGEEAADARVMAKHQFFVDLLSQASEAEPGLSAAARLLADDKALDSVRRRFKEHQVRPTEKVTLCIDGAFPVKSDAWHTWWQSFRQRIAPEGHLGERTMVCLVTGKPVRPPTTHPKVVGLNDVGGLSMGTVLVGFDKDSFGSYGLKQSENAAVSEAAAYDYRAALNELIANHSRRLAGAKVVHWFKAKVKDEEDPLAWLEEPPEVEERAAQHLARELLESIANGKRQGLPDNYYYALTLSGAGGRVMVRDWMEGPFEELVANIGHWFDDLSIVHRDGGRLAPDPAFRFVLRSTVFGRTDRDKDKNLPSPFVAKMWRVAVRREPIPQTAMAKALARTKVDIIGDEPFSHARMGLMKAYHTRSSREDGGYMKSYLNEEHPAPAYHCGRMMAVLAKLQQAALGDVGAGVVQRYYAAASATPALVLGRLVRGGQFHLNKLDPGLAHWYEEKLGSINVALRDNYPVTLTLEEQSLFALGYYQQWVDLRTRKSDDSKKEA